MFIAHHARTTHQAPKERNVFRSYGANQMLVGVRCYKHLAPGGAMNTGSQRIA